MKNGTKNVIIVVATSIMAVLITVSTIWSQKQLLKSYQESLED